MIVVLLLLPHLAATHPKDTKMNPEITHSRITKCTWQKIREFIDARIPRDKKLYGIPRGGAIVAALAGNNVDSPEEAEVIVDDICDTGATRDEWLARYPNKPFIALVTKADLPASDSWIEFPWEEELKTDLSHNIRRLLEGIGENPLREGLIDTPKRVVKAWIEMTSGMHEDPVKVLDKSFALNDSGEGVSKYDQMIVSGEIPFSSNCEHHMMPFFGVAHIAYIPGESGRVVGLSKLARVVDIYARRLQVQERFTQQISDAVEKVLKPAGTAVIVKSRHTCQCFRGIKKEGWMVTSSIHGAFKQESSARNELFHLIKI